MRICDLFISIWSQGLVPRTVHKKGFEGQVAETCPFKFKPIWIPWSLRLHFLTKMASSHDGTCPRDLLQRLVAGTCPLMCADLVTGASLWQRCHSQVNLVSAFPRNLSIYSGKWKTLTKHINSVEENVKVRVFSQVVFIFYGRASNNKS